MISHRPASAGERRVLPFRRRRAAAAPPPVADLAQYEHDSEAEDYRHRMAVNAAAFLFVAVLIAAGVWLAETMADMRKNQDCVLSGRRGCTPVEYTTERW
jgi:hypothetical protein